MKPLFSYLSFRAFLSDELKFRAKRNELYSLRAFARDLKLSHSRLSEFLSAKSPISARSGQIICEALELSEVETAYLIDLIKAEFHPNEAVREAARAAATNQRNTRTIVSKGGVPDLLERWYYIPLIEFLTLSQPPPPAEIASALGLVESDLHLTIEFLEKNGVIEYTGGTWSKSHAFMKYESGLPSPHFKAYHEAFMKTAQRALYTQAIERRKFTTWVFTLDDADLVEARQDVEEFCSSFVRKYADRKSSNSVYSLGVQFFEIGSQDEEN
jgi:uncharacterized protein (TIGR02147 family)